MTKTSNTKTNPSKERENRFVQIF
jgi:hypothetical protein